MGWYVLERYIFSMTKTSYLTPEFQRHSLGIGMTSGKTTGVVLRLTINQFLPSGLATPPGTDAASEHAKEEEEEEEGIEEASQQNCDEPAVKLYLTPLELEGLWNLLGKLEALPSNKKCVPAGIHNAPALMTHVKVLSSIP